MTSQVFSNKNLKTYQKQSLQLSHNSTETFDFKTRRKNN